MDNIFDNSTTVRVRKQFLAKHGTVQFWLNTFFFQNLTAKNLDQSLKTKRPRAHHLASQNVGVDDDKNKVFDHLRNRAFSGGDSACKANKFQGFTASFF